MGDVHPEDSGQAVRWTPNHDEEEMLFVLPLPAADYRFLWSTWRGRIPPGAEFFPGDVWLYVDQSGEQRLFFVGPETTGPELVIHADHAISFVLTAPGAPTLHLYQPGAGRRARLGKSAWDHVNRDGD